MSSFGNRMGQLNIWAYRLGEDLAEGEVLLAEAYGSWVGRFAALKGRLILTNLRLVFRSRAPMASPTRCEYRWSSGKS